MTPPTDSSPPPSPAPSHLTARVSQFFSDYFWFILKNVIGWILILSAGPIGILIPGPGGLPLFLIGFAMVAFPGKRRLTARVLRGRRMRLDERLYTAACGLLALIAPVVLLWFLAERYGPTIERYRLAWPILFAVCLFAVAVTWLVARLALRTLDFILRNVPRARRRIRPWLRRRGIHLLPPRRRRRKHGSDETRDDDEILHIHERHHHRARYVWSVIKPWLGRSFAIAIAVAIFIWILRPIRQDWETVRGEIDVGRFLLAAVMFLPFLGFRALSWRRILVKFGERLPWTAAVRVWSVSEMARYLPGPVWQQFIGRALLGRPYGVSADACITSQILERAVFLMANILFGFVALLWFGAKMSGTARPSLYAAIALVLLLGALLHPAILYRLINGLLRWAERAPIVQRLSGVALTRLLMRLVLALLWQSAAVYVLTAPVLGLNPDWWWAVAGAYCLAWSAGFLAVWAPAGIGVRELVFIGALHLILPDSVFAESAHPHAIFGYLAVLLRLWTIAGELLFACLAIALDYRGAMGRVSAPEPVAEEALR